MQSSDDSEEDQQEAAAKPKVVVYMDLLLDLFVVCNSPGKGKKLSCVTLISFMN